MKKSFIWLLAGLVGLVCAGPALVAQNVALTEPLIGLARPTNGLVGLSPTGALLRSTNNGVSFASVRAADAPRALYALAASGSTVVAIGDAAYFVRSTDDGVTWSALASALSPAHDGPMNAVAANGSTWVAVGEGGGSPSVLRSTNGGSTWVKSTVPSVFGVFNGIAWSGTRWVAVGGDGAFGFVYTSTDGASWTLLSSTMYPLYSVASNSSGKVVAVGDAGTVLYASDGGATSSSFASVGANLVSEALRSVAFLSGDNWIIGGDNLALVSFSSATTTPALVSGPSATSTTPYLALLSTGTGSNYYYAPSESATATHGPISLQVALVSGQLQLTLVGAQNGFSYHIETSTTLTSWTAVTGSTVPFATGNAAPSWSYPAPAAGARVFYRAVVGSL